MEEIQITRMKKLRADWYNDIEISRINGITTTKLHKLIWRKPKKLYTVEWNTWTLQELCRIYDIRRTTIWTRLGNWYTIEEAFTKPVIKRKWYE